MNRLQSLAFALATAAGGLALAQPPAGTRAASPAADPIPESRVAQSYPAELVAAGSTIFAAQCGFCHGRDARGGAGGSDLARSTLVAEDVRGDRIGEVLRTGRPDAGMPAFSGLATADLDAIVAFIHNQKLQAQSEEGGRQSVDVADLLSGNADRGRDYFETHCSDCHAADGDLAGIASRLQGLRLLQRMLYPQGGGPGPNSSRAQSTVEVRAMDGERIAGALAYRDEFVIALRDSAGRYRSFATGDVEFTVDNPLDAHIEQLGRYTDPDMHDLITYLHTLR
jgi:cytochrome c oxidase cbb3-type subunit 3